MKKLISQSELLDRFVGERGSIARGHFEAELRADILAAKNKRDASEKKNDAGAIGPIGGEG